MTTPDPIAALLWEELRFVKGATDDVIDRIALRLAALIPPTPEPPDGCGNCHHGKGDHSSRGAEKCGVPWCQCPGYLTRAASLAAPSVEALAEALPQHRTCSDDVSGHESCLRIARKQWANLRRGS